jgi:hypothetical protein
MAQPLGNHSRLHLESLEDRHLPSTMAGVYADGTWRWDSIAGWAHISSMQAGKIDVDDAGNVYARYLTGSPTDGLWRWNAATASWAKLSNLQADTYQVTAGGVLYGDFGNQGLWRWDNSGWMLLTALSPGKNAVSDSDAYFGTFDTGSPGTWRWTPAAGWSLLSSSIPIQIQTDSAGDFVGVFPASGPVGTWRWSPTSGWAHLSTTGPWSIDVSANGAIYENRDGSVWYAAPGAASFSLIDSALKSAATMAALPDGSLFVQVFETGFNRGWYWNPQLRGLGFVNLFLTGNLSSEPAVGKDGDLFFGDATPGASGTGYWSLTSPYHLLGGPNVFPLLRASQR